MSVARFAVFASGGGSNLQAIMDAVKAGTIPADLALVFSDKASAFALERAKKAGIPAMHIDPKQYSDRESFEKVLVERLKDYRLDFIVLAGYMRLLTPYILKCYPDRILNIHPSLLPAFKGAHAIRDAFEARAAETGVTVHFVDEEMDHGAIILQQGVAVDPQDTLESLEAKIHAVEHVLYPKAVALMAQGRLKIHNHKVEIL